MADFTIKQGSRLPSIRRRLDAPGIGSAASVAFHMKLASGTTVKTGAGVIESVVNANAIIVRYDWGATDTDTLGSWNGEFWAVIAGLTMKVPNDSYIVVDVLDDAA